MSIWCTFDVTSLDRLLINKLITHQHNVQHLTLLALFLILYNNESNWVHNRGLKFAFIVLKVTKFNKTSPMVKHHDIIIARPHSIISHKVLYFVIM